MIRAFPRKYWITKYRYLIKVTYKLGHHKDYKNVIDHSNNFITIIIIANKILVFIIMLIVG